ncbi:MAG: DUF11 domain-containing protein [Acidobacteria bacterium]|nr:DUF11 domain-containing protein [Acidobacteriota bacterium]
MRKLLLFLLLFGSFSLAIMIGVHSQERSKSKVPRLTTDDVSGTTHNPTGNNENDTKAVQPSGKDGITSIAFKELFKAGETKVTRINPGSVTDLPTGCTVYNNLAFDVTTEAIASGPHTIVFSVASVQDPNVFAHLRVLSRERNILDPATTTWIDRTVAPPSKSAPDFANKTITGKPDELGQIVVVIFDPQQMDKLPMADLSVQITGSPDPVVQGENTTYTFTVRNSGPQEAPDVVFNGVVDTDMQVVSMASSQGDCRQSEQSDSTVICHIGTLSTDRMVTVTVVTKPRPNLAYSKGKQKYSAMSIVISKARESNYTNNQARIISK